MYIKTLIFSTIIIISCITNLYAQNEIQLLPSDTFAIHAALNNAEIEIKAGNKKEESRFYDDIGLIYWEHNHFSKAIEFYEKSLQLNEQISNLSGASMINQNLGMIYADKSKYDKSLYYFQKALDYRRMVKDKTGTIMVLINSSVTLNNMKRYEESIKNLNEALSLAREMNDMEQMKSCYGMLSETYEKAKQSDKAYYYFGLYKTFHEQLQQQKVKKVEENIKETQLLLKLAKTEEKNNQLILKLTEKELEEKQLQLMASDSTRKKLYYNLSKSELQRELLERDNQIANFEIDKKAARIKKQNMQMILLVVAICLFLFLIVALIVLFLNKRRDNKQLLCQKLEIAKQRDSINEAYNQLKELNEFKEGMSLMIAHDLKNPLNAILNPSIHQTADKQMIVAKQSGKQMLNLILNFLDVQKSEDKKFKLNLGTYSIYQIADNAVNQIQFLCTPQNISIKNNLPIDINVNADKVILDRIFINLLTNAIKYSFSDTSIEIDFAGSNNNKNCKISVTNKGDGIPQEFMPYVFQKFAQTNAKKSGTIRSTGLGLTFCKMAIEAHNCNIGVESIENKITTFWFTLNISENPNVEKIKIEPIIKESDIKELTNEEKDILLPIIEKLEKFEIFEISSIYKAIKPIENNQKNGIVKWKDNLLLALNNNDEILYKLLLLKN